MSRLVPALLAAILILQCALEFYRSRPQFVNGRSGSTTSSILAGDTAGGTSSDRPSSNPEFTDAPAEGGHRPFGFYQPHSDLIAFNRFPELELPFDLSSCKFVYLDLGTNEGWQIEKLFLGVKPTSPWAKKFSQYFNPDYLQRQKDVCCIGAEPDLNHKKTLDILERNLTALGVRLKIFRNPIWVNNDVMTFNSVFDPSNNHDASTLATTGVSIVANGRRTMDINVTRLHVRGLRLATLLAQLHPNATVLAKLDIEGAEHRVISDIVLTGTICRIKFLGIEVHYHLMKTDVHSLSSARRLNQFLEASKQCNTWARLFDDET